MSFLCAFASELSSRIPEDEKGAAKYLDLIWLLGPIIVVAWIWIKNGTYLAVQPELLVFGVLGVAGFLGRQVGGRRKNRERSAGL